MRVRVIDAPGYEEFEGDTVPGLDHIKAIDRDGPLTAIVDDSSDIFIIPSKFVHKIGD